jgi:hypothetical protein
MRFLWRTRGDLYKLQMVLGWERGVKKWHLKAEAGTGRTDRHVTGTNCAIQLLHFRT